MVTGEPKLGLLLGDAAAGVLERREYHRRDRLVVHELRLKFFKEIAGICLASLLQQRDKKLFFKNREGHLSYSQPRFKMQEALLAKQIIVIECH